MNPTAEQQAAVDAFSTGDDLILEAGAGTGKTSTLQLLAERTRDRGIYVAYNRAIADEAAGRFPRNVKCKTAHSLAYAAVGHTYRNRMDGSSMQPLWKVAKHLNIGYAWQAGDRHLSVTTLARLAQEMVDNFCNSADRELGVQHVPYVEGMRVTNPDGSTHDYHRELAHLLLPMAEIAWADLQDPTKVDSLIRFKHDHYLKIWQLNNPVLETEYILFDEAQDANPVIASIIGQQDCQKVLVGDRAQAIYGWRGAVDAMETFDAPHRLYLSQSFRFGPAVAEFANTFLSLLDTPLRLTGTDTIDSHLGAAPQPRALLTRSNAGGLDALIGYQAEGVKAHLMGGADDVGRFVKGVQQLQSTGKCSHRDLIAFDSWDEVVQYCKDDRKNAGTLATWVSIIERYGVDVVNNAVATQWQIEDTAEVTISTAHKAKGREWSSVRIADDFEMPVDKETLLPKPPTPADTMLRYVAVTRARDLLDPGPLWGGDDPSADAYLGEMSSYDPALDEAGA